MEKQSSQKSPPPKPPKPTKPPKPAALTSTYSANKNDECATSPINITSELAQCSTSDNYSLKDARSQRVLPNGPPPRSLQAVIVPTPPSPRGPSASSPTYENEESSDGGRVRSLSPMRRISAAAGSFDLRSTLSAATSMKSSIFSFDPEVLADLDCIKAGGLSKMNREGKFEKCIFILTDDEIIYTKQTTVPGAAPTVSLGSRLSIATITSTSSSSSAAAIASASDTSTIGSSSTADNNGTSCHQKSIPLNTVLVLPISEADHCVLAKAEKRSRTFKLLSKHKSFYLRAASDEEKDAWLDAIHTVASQVQQQELGQLVSPEDLAPMWATNHSNCQLCSRAFTFFARKHHCRNCGTCVCEGCSLDKVRILRLDERKLFRVCNPCGQEIKNNRVYGVGR